MVTLLLISLVFCLTNSGAVYLEPLDDYTEPLVIVIKDPATSASSEESRSYERTQLGINVRNDPEQRAQENNEDSKSRDSRDSGYDADDDNCGNDINDERDDGKEQTSLYNWINNQLNKIDIELAKSNVDEESYILKPLRQRSKKKVKAVLTDERKIPKVIHNLYYTEMDNNRTIVYRKWIYNLRDVVDLFKERFGVQLLHEIFEDKKGQEKAEAEEKELEKLTQAPPPPKPTP